jgi:hypothetical protein
MDLNFYKRLARDGVKGADHLVKAIDGSPDQPRDPDGKWGSGGGGGKVTSKGEPSASIEQNPVSKVEIKKEGGWKEVAGLKGANVAGAHALMSSSLEEKGTSFRIHHSGGIHEGTVS